MFQYAVVVSVYINIHKEIKKSFQKLQFFVFPPKIFFQDEYIFTIIIFAKYDLKSISKDIQRVESGETVKLKNNTNILNFYVFSKKNHLLHYFIISVVLM